MPVITERDSDHYLEHGHREGCGLWWIADGVLYEETSPEDGFTHGYCDDYDEGSVSAQGRIDHERKLITTIEVYEGLNRSPSAERRLEYAVNRISRKYPDYGVVVYW